jgi:hypothetical protein
MPWLFFPGSADSCEATCGVTCVGIGEKENDATDRRLNPRYDWFMDDFPISPPVIVKDTPKPRRLTTLREVREYVDEAMRVGRPAPWREVWHRLKTVGSEEDLIEAIGDLRELLIEEDLLLPGT